MINKEKFIIGINLLKKSLPKIEIDVEASYFMLSELKFEDFMFAIKNIVLDKNFKLYDNVIGEIYSRAINKDNINQNDAWDEVMAQISAVGWCGSPKFSNKLIRKAIDQNGGWRNLCTSTKIDWDKKSILGTLKELQENKNVLNQNLEIENKEVKKIISSI